MSDKQLHRHILPVVLSIMVVFMLSVVLVIHVGGVSKSTYGDSFSDANKALITSFLRINPNKDGLATISLSDSNTTAPKTSNSIVLSAGKDIDNGISANAVIQQMEAQLNSLVLPVTPPAR